jgi:DNA-binding transcriptional LysR family regulator
VAQAGVAITLEPDFIVGDAIRDGRLVAVLPGFTPPASAINAVYPSRRHLSAKVRAFVDFLAARFAAAEPWALARSAQPARGRRPPRQRPA